MKIQFRCGCGGVNYNREDWLCHFRHRSLWRALRHLLLTRIEIS